jgi:hypothetical protein
MPNQVQTLKSNVSGNRPSGRLPGELYVNWADSQLGAVNSTNNPQDLIGVRFFSATANYNIGDFIVEGGQLYRAAQAITAGAFNATQWTPVGGSVSVGDAPPTGAQAGALWYDSTAATLYVLYNDGNSTQWVVAVNQAGAYLPLNGGTMNGDIVLRGDPTAALMPATKEYVDAGISGNTASITSLWQNIRYRNRVINGDVSVDQRHSGAATPVTGTMVTYACDRWAYTGQGVGTIKQAVNTASDLAATGKLNCLGWQTTTAHVVAAADTTQFYQGIEGCNFNDAQWGTANAQPVVLEFWVYSTLIGTFAGALQNVSSPSNRAYVFTYSIPTANTWTKIRLTIPGDTAGTWSVANNANALWLVFNLGAGSTYATAAGSWTAGNFFTAPGGVVNPVATLNATWFVTGVALMVGANAQNAEPEFKDFASNLRDCQRYFEKSYTYGVAPGTASAGAPINNYGSGYASQANQTGGSVRLQVTKRAIPTNHLYSNVTGTIDRARDQVGSADVAVGSIGPNDSGFYWSAAASVASSNINMAFHFTSDADF